MALTLTTAARNAGCDAVVDLVDGGAPGKLKIKDAAVLGVTITLENPAFEAAGTGSPGQARAFGQDGVTPVSGSNVLTATATAALADADNYDVTTSADVVIWSGTVTGTGGGGDMELDNTNIANGQTVNVTSWTHTVPAS